MGPFFSSPLGSFSGRRSSYPGTRESWVGVLLAFRILASIADRLAFYALLAFAWKSWRCARAGFSRNEMRALLSLVVFVAAGDLLWLATDAKGAQALPCLAFRATFYQYAFWSAWLQGRSIREHLGRLGVAHQEAVRSQGVVNAWAEELGAKARRYRTHAYAHQVTACFILAYGAYAVGYLAVGTQGFLPRAVPVELLEELGYLLAYLFLATCILQRLIF